MSDDRTERVRASPLARGAALRRLCEGPGCRACSAALAAGPAGAPTSGGAGPGEAKRVGVAVVDDDDEVRRVVLGVVHASNRFLCCGCFSAAAAALEAIPRLPVDIVLVGLSLPDLCGIQCVGNLRLLRPGLYIVLMTPAALDQSILGRAIAAGADKCCQKPLDGKRCLELLRSAAGDLAAARAGLPLTAREQEALACRARGIPWKAIPKALGISWCLAKKLQQRIHLKLGVQTSLAAVSKWRELRGGGQAGAGQNRGEGRPSKRQQ